VLAPHLRLVGTWAKPLVVKTRLDDEGRQHAGGGDWLKWRKDIELLLRDSRPSVRVTTLFDLYRLPGNFPRRAEYSKVRDTGLRCALLERAMAEEISDPRFLPYLQRHEFETLVLAGLSELKHLLEDREDQLGLRALLAELGDKAPEEINDGETTAPSKRLARFIPSYAPAAKGASRFGKGKSIYGPAVTERFGLARLRERCPRFDAWVSKLESLNR
jgi:hypothetical protein